MTPIGTELVTVWGERLIVVEVEDADSYLARRSAESRVPMSGGSAERSAMYGAASFREQERRDSERKRMNEAPNSRGRI